MSVIRFMVSMSEEDILCFEAGREAAGMSKSAYIRLLIAEHEHTVPGFIKYKEVIHEIAEMNTLLKGVCNMSEGIVCKVWNISATKKKGSKSQLSDSINYIFDDEKTEAKLSAESIEQFNKKQLGRECRYIENDIKTVDGAYIGVQNLVSSDVHGAVKEMMDVKKFYGKMGAGLHYTELFLYQ